MSTTVVQKVQATPEMIALAKMVYEDVQYACNGVGLSKSFARAFEYINKTTGCTGATNQHPIIVLWIDKFCSLARMDQGWNDKAWDAVRRLVNGEDVEYEVIEA